MTRRGEIYWVNLGTPVGSEQGFRRPALIIQNDVGNSVGPTTIVAAVSSRLPPRQYPHVVIVHPEDSGLPAASAILLNQLRTVDQSRLQQKCGELASEQMAEVDEALRVSLGIA